MVLVSGATGLLGGHLLYRFRESATSTIALYRSKENIAHTRLIFESYGAGQGALVDHFKWMEADLLEVPSLDAAMKGVTEVYHCAAIIEADSFEEMKRHNITGTENLINVALYWDVKRFCHVSSIAALGESVGERAINETDFFNLDALNTDYAISKFGAEMEAWRATQEGMQVIIVNPGIILGEGKWSTGSGKLFSRTFKGNTFYTSGSSGFIDVRDVTRVMVDLMKSNIEDERFILIAENKSYREVLHKIANSLKVKPPKYLLPEWVLKIASLFSYFFNFIGVTKKLKSSTVRSLTSSTAYDNAKVREQLELNFTPLDETIDRVAQFMLKNKDL